MCTQMLERNTFPPRLTRSAYSRGSKYLYLNFLETQRAVAPPLLLDHNSFNLPQWGTINDTFLRLCLKWDCLSSPAGTLPGKILTVRFNAPSYKPKHVYLFLQFKRPFSPSPLLYRSPTPPATPSVINFMGISMEFFLNIQWVIVWGWGTACKGVISFSVRHGLWAPADDDTGTSGYRCECVMLNNAAELNTIQTFMYSRLCNIKCNHIMKSTNVCAN